MAWIHYTQQEIPCIVKLHCEKGLDLPEASTQCYVHCSVYVHLRRNCTHLYCNHVPLYTYFTLYLIKTQGGYSTKPFALWLLLATIWNTRLSKASVLFLGHSHLILAICKYEGGSSAYSFCILQVIKYWRYTWEQPGNEASNASLGFSVLWISLCTLLLSKFLATTLHICAAPLLWAVQGKCIWLQCPVLRSCKQPPVLNSVASVVELYSQLQL